MFDEYLVEKKGKRDWRDILVTVDGVAVCYGDMRFVAEALGLGYSTLRMYKANRSVAGLTVELLPEMWFVDGQDHCLTSEEASAILGCPVEGVARSGARRARWRNFAMPSAMIDSLRREEKRKRLAAKRAAS